MNLIPFFFDMGRGRLFIPTQLFSLISCRSFREPLKCPPLWNPPYSHTTPYFDTCCSLSLDCPFSILFLANSYSSFKRRSTCQRAVKPSPSYPPCPQVSASRVHTSMGHLSYFFEIFQEKPGYHLVSHTRYTQYEHQQGFDSSEYI